MCQCKRTATCAWRRTAYLDSERQVRVLGYETAFSGTGTFSAGVDGDTMSFKHKRRFYDDMSAHR